MRKGLRPLFLWDFFQSSHTKVHSDFKAYSEVGVCGLRPHHVRLYLLGLLRFLGTSLWLGNALRPFLILPVYVTVWPALVILAIILSYVTTHIYDRRAGNKCSDKARRYPQDHDYGRWYGKKSCQISNLELDITRFCVIIVICWRYTLIGPKRKNLRMTVLFAWHLQVLCYHIYVG